MKIITLVLVMLALVVGGLAIKKQSVSNTSSSNATSGVKTTDGTQIVTIVAKAGYTPASSVVQAGVPTTIRFVTKSAFDCSTAVRIPSLDISKNLPVTGTTDIDIGSLAAGETLQGTCGMGMYQFVLKAE